MTAATETTALEYGVRFTWPGGVTQTLGCTDFYDAVEFMRTLAADGVTVMEMVTRPGWSLCPEGLPPAVRLLAEARLDGQVDDGIVRARLAAWLHETDVTGAAITKAWQDLLAAAQHHREADDADSLTRVHAAARTLLGDQS